MLSEDNNLFRSVICFIFWCLLQQFSWNLKTASSLIINPLTDDKVLVWFKSKPIKDDKLKVVQTMKFTFERGDNIIGKGEKYCLPAHCYVHLLANQKCPELVNFNPLPDMPILGSSNSEANKDMMSKIWTTGYTNIWLS